MLEGLQHLLVHGLISLSKVLSPLGMSDDDILNACIHQHCRRNLAGISSLLLEVHVLGTDVDVGALGRLHGRDDVNGGHTEHYVHLIVHYKGLQCINQLYRLTGSHVHLPVAGNDLLSCHDSILDSCLNSVFYFQRVIFRSAFSVKAPFSSSAVPIYHLLPPRREAPCPQGTQGKLRRRWRYGSSCHRSPTGSLPPRNHRRQ